MKITFGQLRRIIREEVEQEKLRKLIRRSVNEGFFDSAKRKALSFGIGDSDPKVVKAAENLLRSMPIPGFEDVVFKTKTDETLIQFIPSKEDQQAFVNAYKDPKTKAALNKWRVDFQNKVDSDPRFEGYEIDPVVGYDHSRNGPPLSVD